MKKLLFASLAIVCFSFSQVKAQSKSPSDVAVGFIKSLVTLNFKQAETFVRSQDSAKLAQAETSVNQQASSMPDSVKQILNTIKCTPSNEKILGDSATVDVIISRDKGLDSKGTKQKTEPVHLIKVDGMWKAILDTKGN